MLQVGYGALGGSDVVHGRPTQGALRDALSYADIGVFVGVESSGLSSASEQTSTFSASGGALSIASGRLSFSLGLVGPCYSIDTACASSLAALHTCVTALKTGGECDEGLGVGTKVLSEAANVATSIGGMTSSLGRCHTFDRRADGYCRGEGCCAFLARRSGGVEILASAVQQDGPSASLTAPNGSSQQRLIEAVRGSGAGPALEAHGTGTALGDPIEARGLALWTWSMGSNGPSPQVGAATRALCGPGRDGERVVECASLKSNMGHLEAAAAAAGLSSLLVGTLSAMVVAVNAQLRESTARACRWFIS